MFRRLSVAPRALARTQAQTRSYFHFQHAEEGISRKTQHTMNNGLLLLTGAGVFMIYKVVFGYYSPHRQWVCDSTDLWENDGTVMEGDEAVANIRLQHERIMPFMEELARQMEEGVGPKPEAAAAHAHH